MHLKAAERVIPLVMKLLEQQVGLSSGTIHNNNY